MATKKTPKWMRELKAADRAHLRETTDGTPTLAKFRLTRAFQHRDGVPCAQCRHIALVLGVEAPEQPCPEQAELARKQATRLAREAAVAAGIVARGWARACAGSEEA